MKEKKIPRENANAFCVREKEREKKRMISNAYGQQ